MMVQLRVCMRCRALNLPDVRGHEQHPHQVRRIRSRLRRTHLRCTRTILGIHCEHTGIPLRFTWVHFATDEVTAVRPAAGTFTGTGPAGRQIY